MITLSAFYAVTFFHIINIKNFFIMYQKLLHVKQLYLLLLFFFMLVWGLSFLIPIYYSPALMIIFAMAMPTAIGLFMQYKQNKLMIDKVSVVLILITFLAMYFCLFKVYFLYKYILLVFSSLTLGFGVYVYIKLSHKMNKHGITASQILASRYWLLFLVPLMFTIKNHHLSLINYHILIQTLFISSISLIIPVYCAQLSIEKIGPDIHSILIGITPFIAYILESFFIDKESVHSLDGVFSLILFVIIFLRYVLKKFSTDKFKTFQIEKSSH